MFSNSTDYILARNTQRIHNFCDVGNLCIGWILSNFIKSFFCYLDCSKFIMIRQIPWNMHKYELMLQVYTYMQRWETAAAWGLTSAKPLSRASPSAPQREAKERGSAGTSPTCAAVWQKVRSR